MGGCTKKIEPDLSVLKTGATDTEGSIPVTRPNLNKDMDIFIDSTPSMKGFAAKEAPSEGFISILKGINSISTSLSGTTGVVSYYGFGKHSYKITQNQFNSAIRQDFYSEDDNNKETNLEAVFSQVAKKFEANKGSKGYMGIIISDFFGQDSNFTPVLDKIKKNYLEKDMAIGILAVRSYFDGTVFDIDRLSGGKLYKSEKGNNKSYRPFYVALLGRYEDVNSFYSQVDEQAMKGIKDQRYFEIYSKDMVNGNVSFLQQVTDIRTINSDGSDKNMKARIQNYIDYKNKYAGNNVQFFKVSSLAKKNDKESIDVIHSKVRLNTVNGTRLFYYINGGKNISANASGNLVNMTVSIEKADNNGKFEVYDKPGVLEKDSCFAEFKDGEMEYTLKLKTGEIENGWYRIKASFNLRTDILTPIMPEEWNMKNETASNYGTSTIYIYNLLEGIYSMSDKKSLDIGELYYYIKK